MKRSREALEETHKKQQQNNKNDEGEQHARQAQTKTDDLPGEEEEDRNKLPQVLGDESKQAILVDPRRWARERLATALREQGAELEQNFKPKGSNQAPLLAGAVPAGQKIQTIAPEAQPAASPPTRVPPKMNAMGGCRLSWRTFCLDDRKGNVLL